MGRSGATGRDAVLLLAALALSSCGGGGGGGGRTPSPGTEAPPQGATRVTGAERLAWAQAGDASSLTFVAYVDGNRVTLDAARCDGDGAGAQCSSPLPSMSDGIHTLAVAAVSTPSDLESARSEAITVQKVSAGSVVSTAALPDAGAPASVAGVESFVTAPDGRSFVADVIARALDVPFQMAAAPDGRVFVSDARGRVLSVRPDSDGLPVVALEAARLFDPPPSGTLAIEVHPDFEATRLVYVAFLADDGSHAPRLRIVRLREAGDRLGEPATIFETTLARGESVGGSVPATSPRMAFGPDGLLHVLLPMGVSFDRDPAASQPVASMIRLTAEGRRPEAAFVAGVESHPLGFGWQGGTGTLLGVIRHGTQAAIRPMTAAAAGVPTSLPVAFDIVDDGSGVVPTLALTASRAVNVSSALGVAMGQMPAGAVRLLGPVVATDSALPWAGGRVLDIVAEGGTVLVGVDEPSLGGDRVGTIVRLRPR